MSPRSGCRGRRPQVEFLPTVRPSSQPSVRGDALIRWRPDCCHSPGADHFLRPTRPLHMYKNVKNRKVPTENFQGGRNSGNPRKDSVPDGGLSRGRNRNVPAPAAGVPRRAGRIYRGSPIRMKGSHAIGSNVPRERISEISADWTFCRARAFGIAPSTSKS